MFPLEMVLEFKVWPGLTLLSRQVAALGINKVEGAVFQGQGVVGRGVGEEDKGGERSLLGLLQYSLIEHLTRGLSL